MRALALLLALSLSQLASAALQEEGDDAPCAIVGRLLDGAGQPVVGATLELHGWGANSSRIQQFGRPENWTDPAPVHSDADGRFRLEWVPPRAFQFALDLTHDDFGSIAWRWSEIAPGATVDLEDTTLEPRALIVGHIVNAEGELLVEGWRVMASHNWNSASARRPRSSLTVHASVDPDTGTFRIEDLPPGEVRLTASNASGTRIDVVKVVSKVDEPTEVELVYDGPDPRRRIVLTIFSRPFYTFRPAEGTVHAIAANGTRAALAPAPGRSNDWHVLDIEPGVYTLEIDDPRYERWRLEDVRTGSNPRAFLTGSAALELSVVDPANGNRPVTEYGLRLTFENANFSPSTFTLLEDDELAPAGGRFGGILPGSWLIEVRPKGAPPQFVQAADLAAGETRVVEVRLGVAGAVAGRVLQDSSLPAAGTRVQLTRGEVPGHDGPPGAVLHTSLVVDGKPRSLRVTYRDEELVSDAVGGFQFNGLAPGTYALRAIVSPWVRVDATVEVVEGETAQCALTLPPVGNVGVRVVVPDGVDATRLFAGVRAETGGIPLMSSGREQSPGAVRLGADGTCTLVGLPVGVTAVHLSWLAEQGLGYSFPATELGEAEVRAGERVELSVDMRARFPARGELRIDVGGAPADSVSVSLERVVDGDAHADGGSLYASIDEGRGVVEGVVPGRYRVAVESYRGGWRWSSPHEVVVRSAEPFEVALDVPLVRRTLHVRDAGGNDLAGAKLSWTADGGHFGSGAGETDAAGRLPLVLPPGNYTLRRTGERTGGVEFEFAAGDDELEVTLTE